MPHLHYKSAFTHIYTLVAGVLQFTHQKQEPFTDYYGVAWDAVRDSECCLKTLLIRGLQGPVIEPPGSHGHFLSFWYNNFQFTILINCSKLFTWDMISFHVVFTCSKMWRQISCVICSQHTASFMPCVLLYLQYVEMETYCLSRAGGGNLLLLVLLTVFIIFTSACTIKISHVTEFSVNKLLYPNSCFSITFPSE